VPDLTRCRLDLAQLAAAFVPVGPVDASLVEPQPAASAASTATSAVAKPIRL
jgi:hypothetical protein